MDKCPSKEAQENRIQRMKFSILAYFNMRGTKLDGMVGCFCAAAPHL